MNNLKQDTQQQGYLRGQVLNELFAANVSSLCLYPNEDKKQYEKIHV
jgi:hypothetical protein